MTTKDSIMNERLRHSQTTQELVAVYLVNGVKLVGKVEKFDDDSVHLTSNIDGGVTIERRSISAVQKNIERKGPSTTANR